MVRTSGMYRCVCRMYGSVRSRSSAVNVVLVVAGSKVLVEHGPVAAVERVLLPVRVAEVVHLHTKYK